MGSRLEQPPAPLWASGIEERRRPDVSGPHLHEVRGQVLVLPKDLGYFVIVLSHEPAKRAFPYQQIPRILDGAKQLLQRLKENGPLSRCAAFE